MGRHKQRQRTHGELFKKKAKVRVDGKEIRRNIYITNSRKTFVIYNGRRRFIQNRKGKWFAVAFRFASVRGI